MASVAITTSVKGRLTPFLLREADNLPAFELVADTNDKASGSRALRFTNSEVLTYPAAGNISSSAGTTRTRPSAPLMASWVATKNASRSQQYR